MNSINLSKPFHLINGQVIKNRLFKSAMSEQLGDKHHNPTIGLVNLYQRWADGGIGLSMTGNVMVGKGNALGEPKNVVLDERSDLTVFRQWANAGKQNGAQIWMQLNHPGKRILSSCAMNPVAPLLYH